MPAHEECSLISDQRENGVWLLIFSSSKETLYQQI